MGEIECQLTFLKNIIMNNFINNYYTAIIFLAFIFFIISKYNTPILLSIIIIIIIYYYIDTNIKKNISDKNNTEAKIIDNIDNDIDAIKELNTNFPTKVLEVNRGTSFFKAKNLFWSSLGCTTSLRQRGRLWKNNIF